MSLPTTREFLTTHGFVGRATEWIVAAEQVRVAEWDLECALFSDHDGRDDPHADSALPILPGRECDRITYDLCDWDGISLEFKDYVGDLPNEQEQAAIFALGFTVIDIEHKPDGDKTVIWRQVKDYPHGHCSCHKEECGCHPPHVLEQVARHRAAQAAKKTAGE